MRKLVVSDVLEKKWPFLNLGWIWFDTCEWTYLKQKHFLLLKRGQNSKHTYSGLYSGDQWGINTSMKCLKLWQSFKGLYGKEEIAKQDPHFHLRHCEDFRPWFRRGNTVYLLCM